MRLLSGEATKNWLEVREFHAILSFGAAVLSTVQTREIVSVVRASAGRYTITLPRIFRHLVEVRVMPISVSGVVIFPVVAVDSVATAGTLVVEFRTETGTATDPATGSKALVCVAVSLHPFNDATV